MTKVTVHKLLAYLDEHNIELSDEQWEDFGDEIEKALTLVAQEAREEIKFKITCSHIDARKEVCCSICYSDNLKQLQESWEETSKAYASGAEAMREMAAKLVETEHKVCLPLMCETARKVRALNLPEAEGIR